MRSSALSSTCLQLLLEPVIRFLFRHGVKLQEFVEHSKAVYLKLAETELKNQGLSQNVSRLSVMTGVHRRDVVRLNQSDDALKESTNIVTKVIGQWQLDSRFSSKKAGPRALTTGGKKNQFAELVQAVSTDVNPASVLFELERMKAVERTSTGVTLIKQFLAPADFEHAFQLLSNDTDDLISAIDENVVAGVKIKNLHLKTEYDNIPPSALVQIRNWLLDEGSAFHERARKFLAQFDRDIQPPVNRGTSSVPQKKVADRRRLRVALCSFGRVEELKK